MEWTEYIDERIHKLIDDYHQVLNDSCLQFALQRIKHLEDEVIKLKQPQNDPLTKQITGLREDLAELGLRRKGEVIDLPALPTRKRA